METGCRHWERIDSTTEMKQQILSVGAPNQIVIEEGEHRLHGLYMEILLVQKL